MTVFIYLYVSSGEASQTISKEMNNDNDLNLHCMTKLSGGLRYCMFDLDFYFIM